MTTQSLQAVPRRRRCRNPRAARPYSFLPQQTPLVEQSRKALTLFEWQRADGSRWEWWADGWGAQLSHSDFCAAAAPSRC